MTVSARRLHPYGLMLPFLRVIPSVGNANALEHLVTVEDEKLTLNDIEHRILRPIWDDSKIHSAVNCAAIGFPNLQALALTPEKAEQLLEEGVRNCTNDQRIVCIEQMRSMESSSYSWFRSDFDQDGGVIAHIKRYAEPVLLAELERIDPVSGFDYDWSLNTSSSPEE